MTSTADEMFAVVRDGLAGYVINRYSWLDRRSCLFSIDDVLQLANVAVLHAAQRWEQIATDILGDPNASPLRHRALVWSCVKTAVKRDILRAAERAGVTNREAFDVSIDGELERYEASGSIDFGVRTALRYEARYSIEHNDLVDYFSVFPKRDKVHLALKFFDGLTADQAGAVLGLKGKTYSQYTLTAQARLRTRARNLFTTQPVPEPARRPLAWDVPETLVTYVAREHGDDVEGWLGFYTRCMRLDVQYVTDIISTDTFVPDVAHSPRNLSMDQVDEIRRRVAAGQTYQHVADAMGINRSSVIRWTHDTAQRTLVV